jgi:hypothetical protein
MTNFKIISKMIAGVGFSFHMSACLNEDIERGICDIPITYSGFIKPLIETKCAIPGCHVAGGSAPGDFTIYGNVNARATAIKTRTADGSMPKVGSITPEEIEKIACWVESGALNN